MNFFSYASNKLKRVLGGARSSADGLPGDADVVIASFPHSGGDLLNKMLTDVVSQLTGINTRTTLPLDCDSIVVPLDIRDKPRLIRESPGLDPPAAKMFCTHATFSSPIRRCVFVYRDAADALCAWHEQCVERETEKAADEKGSIGEFCLQNFDQWQKHTESWLEGLNHSENDFLTVSYESLQRYSIQTLLEVCNFAGLNPSITQCRVAVENHVSGHSIAKRLSRFELESATYNEIQNLAQPLYRRAMMIGQNARKAA